MDEILAKASNQAMSFAIRSGISIASGYAIRTMTKLMDRIPASEQARLLGKRDRLQRKVRAVSASLDLIKMAVARTNSLLDQTLELVADLKHDLDEFDQSVADLAADLSALNQKDSIAYLEKRMDTFSSLLSEAIPLINLSLITSGVNFSNVMSPRISPSRLLQAANRVGPTFELKFYSVFYNPSRLKYVDKLGILAVSWKEEYARAECRLYRIPGDDFSYQLSIQENFDDGRYHDDDETPGSCVIDVQNIEKQYFSASGRLLRLEGSDLAVLVLKVVKNGVPEYVALGECGENESSDSEYLSDDERDSAKPLELMSKTLSLLEYLLRICALQREEQCSILEVCDEKLFLYLQDEVDSAVLPQSLDSKRNSAANRTQTNQMLENDSNINRLSKLSINDKAN
ncbi:Ran-binding-domain-containing protein [Metschnikowia bicuspidata]|uniref:Ran-binding-domain-containing protein n=1 Tax=Metschnikowia bicuspidata TaxID=27322 RepID=A0A4P9ZB56_9ASCO|nr:Ran-binding-domain-containing protein [Metschnikowia bicuspidata]